MGKKYIFQSIFCWSKAEEFKKIGIRVYSVKNAPVSFLIEDIMKHLILHSLKPWKIEENN